MDYFDVVRYHVVDPMHNLFLGIAKQSMAVWKELSLITDKDLAIIQERVNNMNPPVGVGRIPRKIQSGFFSITADEWKNWIILYSPHALYGILPTVHYDCWCIFVEACQLICLSSITKDNVIQSHHLIVTYYKRYEQLYGVEKCTPNLHMACHLKDIILDYGPVYGFWCFSFERYNGILENMKKSWMCPEKQLLQKFLDLQLVSDLDLASLSLIHAQIKMLRQSENVSGSVTQMTFEGVDVIEQAKLLTGQISCIDAREKPFHRIVQPLCEKCFTDMEMTFITEVYQLLYPNTALTRVSRFYMEFKNLIVNGEEFISSKSRSQRSPAIIAHWPLITGVDVTGEALPRVGVIQSFIRHKVEQDESIYCLLARVKWFEEHPRRDYFHKSIVVCSTTFSQLSCATFIPVSRIMGRCVVTQTHFLFDYGEAIAIPYLKILC